MLRPVLTPGPSKPLKLLMVADVWTGLVCNAPSGPPFGKDGTGLGRCRLKLSKVGGGTTGKLRRGADTSWPTGCNTLVCALELRGRARASSTRAARAFKGVILFSSLRN